MPKIVRIGKKTYLITITDPRRPRDERRRVEVKPPLTEVAKFSAKTIYAVGCGWFFYTVRVFSDGEGKLFATVFTFFRSFSSYPDYYREELITDPSLLAEMLRLREDYQHWHDKRVS